MNLSLSSNSSATIAVAAIMRSAAPRRGCRHPAMGSGGIRIEGDRVELALERTSRGPAESSASATALIAISSGRSSGAIRSRTITMLVSSRPRRGTSLVEGSSGLIGGGILVRPERFRVYRRRSAGHSDELGPCNKMAALTRWHQFADATAVPGHREGLTVLDCIHDLHGSHPHISLGDLGLTGHKTYVAPIAAARRIAAGLFATLDWSARRVGPPESHARHVHGGAETCASPP
jgi:hypothetical protein